MVPPPRFRIGLRPLIAAAPRPAFQRRVAIGRRTVSGPMPAALCRDRSVLEQVRGPYARSADAGPEWPRRTIVSPSSSQSSRISTSRSKTTSMWSCRKPIGTMTTSRLSPSRQSHALRYPGPVPATSAMAARCGSGRQAAIGCDQVISPPAGTPSRSCASYGPMLAIASGMLCAVKTKCAARRQLSGNSAKASAVRAATASINPG